MLPCLAEGDLELADLTGLARRGADLVGVARLVWQHPDGPAAGISGLLAALAAG